MRATNCTQVRWGIEDFRIRFGRDPEGMWLPETAVDLETLDILAEHGIKFTVLAPSQAQAPWMAKTSAEAAHRPHARLSPEACPPGAASRCSFTTARSPARWLSRACSQTASASPSACWTPSPISAIGPQLAHIATDGETYGHHHAYGDMALAYALEHIESKGWRSSPITPNIWSAIRPRTTSRSWKIPPGAACTASDAGATTAAAIRAATPAGIRSGARRCARLWTGCATRSRPFMRSTAARFLQGSLGRARRIYPRHSGPFRREPKPVRRLPFPAQESPPARTASRSGNCSSCSATPC